MKFAPARVPVYRARKSASERSASPSTIVTIPNGLSFEIAFNAPKIGLAAAGVIAFFSISKSTRSSASLHHCALMDAEPRIRSVCACSDILINATIRSTASMVLAFSMHTSASVASSHAELRSQCMCAG